MLHLAGHNVNQKSGRFDVEAAMDEIEIELGLPTKRSTRDVAERTMAAFHSLVPPS
jgi:hypothetical protein